MSVELKPCQSQMANDNPPLIKAECVGVIRHPTDQNMLITVKAQKLSFDVDLAQKELCQAVKQIIDSVRFDEVRE
jgi:hypothetical protein